LDPIVRDLEKWLPRLVSSWRSARKLKEGPPDRLLPFELREVASGVRSLSQGLTRARELAGARYMDDPKLLGAYLLFYWPVSYAQARHALQELSGRPRSVLDLGSGPGPVAFACLDAGAIEVTAADRSSGALSLARALAAEAGESLATRVWNASSGELPAEGGFDLVVMSHLVNELWPGAPDAAPRRASVIERALAHVRPNGSLLIVEPALRETSREILAARDLLIESGYAVRSPCLFQGPCPALVRESDWCHAERPWEAPPLVQAIARAAGLHKEALKMTYLLLAPAGESGMPQPPGTYRIVSEPLSSKGRLRYIGCGPEGRTGLALQEKHLTQANSDFARLARGDVISVRGTSRKGDGLSLDAGSEVQVMARAGQRLAPAPPLGKPPR
jgi:ribosomal protein RSM22 (predicted rRNA methylase)